MQGAERLAREQLTLVSIRCRKWCEDHGIEQGDTVNMDTGEIVKQ